jgi:hypothetical protein
MFAGHLALICASAFAGAAIVINLAEQPARLLLDDRGMLVQWARSYNGAAPMQAGLALASCVFGILAFWLLRDWRWLLGAALIVANWPYTLLVIKPVNTILHAGAAGVASPDARHLVERWGRLHMGRSVLGVAATLVYLWALHR